MCDCPLPNRCREGAVIHPDGGSQETLMSFYLVGSFVSDVDLKVDSTCLALFFHRRLWHTVFMCDSS